MGCRGEQLRVWTREAALLLAAMALVLRVAIPAGFMPNAPQSPTWPFATVICTGSGPLVLKPGQALPASDPSKVPAKAPTHSTCPFAAQGALLAPVTVALSLSAVKAVLAVEAPPVAQARLAPPTGPPLPARGPPARA